MGTASGIQQGPPRTDDKSEWWATPTVIGLMGFGLTTMMAGLGNLPAPYGNGFGSGANVGVSLFGLAIIFGGLVQILAGVIGLRKGNLFAGSAFLGYGAFWIAYTFTLTTYLGSGLISPPITVGFYGLAAFAFLWMMFTLTFLINSVKHGWGLFFVFLFLFVSFVLLIVKFWQLGAADTISKGEDWAVGGMIILTGLTAWYVATAHLTNANWGRTALPV